MTIVGKNICDSEALHYGETERVFEVSARHLKITG